jgi:Ca-activated chloride channel family protein
VAYAGKAGTVLEPTQVAEASKILGALDRLRAGGSTAGAEGIRQAYALAEQSFDPDGVNRVILATDGDFNVGITDPEQLQDFVERKRASGVYLSVLGFGQGNLNDALMQRLAQNGNGQAAYIDTLGEAQKALVEEAGSALFPIAKDVKIQVEFNPAVVSEYRLIGYETRALRREDFNNDKVDAGEIGSGHAVTALYEITPAGAGARLIDDLRYQPAEVPEVNPSEIAYLKIRYKAPDGERSKLIERPITRGDTAAGKSGEGEARFAAAVAGFGQLLRGAQYTGEWSYDDVIALANAHKGADPFGYRAEFVNLVRLAKSTAAIQRLPRQ